MAKTFPLAVVISAVDRVSGPLLKIGSRLSAFNEKAGAIGASLSLAVTAPVLGFFTLATRQALETDKAMKRLQATAGGTTEELAKAAKIAASVPGPFDPHEGLDALTQMIQAGAGLEDAVAALPMVTNLAIASESKLADTAGRVQAVLHEYGLTLADTARVTDMLAVAHIKSKLGLAGVSDELIRLAPLARDLNVPLEQMVGAIITLARGRHDPTAVLRASLSALLKPSRAAAEVFQKLRITRADVFDTEGNLRNLIDVLGKFEAKGADARDFIDIFGKKAGPGMTALLQQGHEGLRTTVEQLQRTGAAAALAKPHLEGVEGALNDLDNSFEDLKKTFAQSGILDNLTTVAKNLSDIVKWLNALDPRIINAIVTLATLAAVLGPVIWGLTKVWWVVTRLWKALGFLAIAWDYIVATAELLAIIIGLPYEAILAIGAAIVAGIVYWDKWTQAVKDFLVQFAPLRRALEWLGINTGPSAAAAKNFDSWLPMSKADKDRAAGFDSWMPAQPAGSKAGSDALKRAGDARRVGTVAPAGQIDVRFLNAPRGLRAEVVRQSGLDLGVDTGFAMIPD